VILSGGTRQSDGGGGGRRSSGGGGEIFVEEKYLFGCLVCPFLAFLAVSLFLVSRFSACGFQKHHTNISRTKPKKVLRS
jgi:hypothetical protein